MMSSACYSPGGSGRSPLRGAEVDLVARRFAVLSDPLRLKLLHALFEGEKSVGELVAATGGSQTNVSRDLQLLSSAGVLVRRRAGLRVFYAIADPTIYALCQLVCAGLERAIAGQAAVLAGETPTAAPPRRRARRR